MYMKHVIVYEKRYKHIKLDSYRVNITIRIQINTNREAI